MKKKSWLIFSFILFLTYRSDAQNPDAFHIDSLGQEDALELNYSWRYKQGDDSLWSQASFDDSTWDTIVLQSHPPDPSAIHWYRLRLLVDSAFTGIPLTLLITQTGASEFYIDGKKAVSYGLVSADKKKEVGYDPKVEPFIFSLNKGAHHVIAIRYSNHISKLRSQPYGPQISINTANEGIGWLYDQVFTKIILTDITLGFFAGLTFLHLLLYFFYKSDRSNLHYSLFTGTFLLMLFGLHFYSYHTSSSAWQRVSYFLPFVYPVFFYFIFLLGTKLFISHTKRNRIVSIVAIVLTIATLIACYFRSFLYPYLLISLVFNVSFSTLFTIWRAYLQKKEGVLILGTGLLLTVLFLIIMLTIMLFNKFTLRLSDESEIVFICILMLSILSIPLSMSVYLARNFAIKSKTLKVKLAEVERLSIQTIAQAKEKEEILSSQNERLENLVKDRTTEVTEQKNKLEIQKEELEIKNREILDSLHYARYLQQVILPPQSFIKEHVQNCFVLYRPKDIVAGDFYYAEKAGDYFFIAAADCTGHGVPGAMLSVLCSNALNQAIKEFGIPDPGLILDKVNELVSATFEKSKQDVNDGMDISLLAISRDKKKIWWAGAYNHLWYTVNGTLQEIRATKQPIGKHHNRNHFASHEIPWQPGACFYLFTDGYADQFGGREGKKYLRKNLFGLIQSVCNKPAAEQEQCLDQTFFEWTGNYEQVDDMTLVGIMI